MKDKKTISRRGFLGGALAAGAVLSTGCVRAPMLVPRHVLGGRPSQFTPPSEKLRIAKIGCGGQGWGDLKGVSTEAIMALCDVDDERAAKAYEKYPNVPKFRDFRVMLEEMGDQIDAVMISTPDHTHAVAAMAAMRMGKHVFVQKPLTHSIHEARELRKAARKYKVVSQMGIQGSASEGARLIYEWVHGGVIGTVREVQCWTNRPVWPQGIDRPSETPPVPETLDWDLWLGPAPMRPYHDAYAPFKWRGWFDFGTGALGDIGCHTMDASFNTLHFFDAPYISVKAECGPFNDETYPEWAIITYEIPARGNFPQTRLVWYDGGKRPPRPEELGEEREYPENGQLFVGDEGKIMAGMYCKSPRIIPESAIEEFLADGKTPKQLWRSPGIYQEWITACKGGPKTGANFDYAGPLTEFAMLGNVAMLTGEEVVYDMKKGKITNESEFNRYLKRPYRKGWHL